MKFKKEIIIFITILVLFLCLFVIYAFINNNKTIESNSLLQEQNKDIILSDLIDKFEESNLSIKDKNKITRSELGAAPYVTDDMYIFKVVDDMNARIFKINKDSDLQILKKYYDEIGKSSALFYSYTYTKGNFLLQMNGEIPEETFNKYVEIMNNNI